MKTGDFRFCFAGLLVFSDISIELSCVSHYSTAFCRLATASFTCCLAWRSASKSCSKVGHSIHLWLRSAIVVSSVIWVKLICSALKASTAASLAAFSAAPAVPPRAATSKPRAIAGKRLTSGVSQVNCPHSCKFKRLVGHGRRFGKVKAYCIGNFMSGGDICAITEPSQNSTNECIIDSGCIKTSI